MSTSDVAVPNVTQNRTGKVIGGIQVINSTKFIQNTIKNPNELMVWVAFAYHSVG